MTGGSGVLRYRYFGLSAAAPTLTAGSAGTAEAVERVLHLVGQNHGKRLQRGCNH